jgi:hypothetical protein
LTASTVYTPASLDIVHGLALEEDAARNGPPPDPREQYIALLAGLAALLRDHPRLPRPYLNDAGVRFNIFGTDARDVMAEACRAIPSPCWTEEPYETTYGLYFMLRGEWLGTPVTLVTGPDSVPAEQVRGEQRRRRGPGRHRLLAAQGAAGDGAAA